MVLKIVSNSSKGRPSSKIKPQLRYCGTAPFIARSLTVPHTANLPILPPGKKVGCTTYESVVKAIRPDDTGNCAPSCKGANKSLVKYFNINRSVNSWLKRPPLP